MQKKLMLIPILLLTLNSSPLVSEQISSTQATPKVGIGLLDKRAQILADYFRQYNSPLENHAQDFVDAADQHGVDWKLVPSISGVESTFGKNAYGYNAWGWGIYGNQALGFKTFKEGIFTVTEGLKQNYINRGLTDPYHMNRVYATSPSWGWRVSYFINDLEEFSGNYPLKQTQPVGNLLTKTAGASAIIAQ